MKEIQYEIVKEIAVLSASDSGYTKEINLICQEDTEGEIKREQTQEQRTEKDSMYELSAKNDRLRRDGRRDL